MLTFDSIVRDGISKIYSEDLDSQTKYLTTLIEDVRKSSVAPILRAQAFFVPNPEYMLEYFGSYAKSSSMDMYGWGGDCLWEHNIVFPIRNIANSIVGLAGFDAIQKFRKIAGERSLDNYYRYSSKEIFNRGKYIYSCNGIYEKAIEEKYALIVDGVFDMHYLVDAGFNAISLMGSTISQEILMQLNFIKYLFVVEDNDAAGRKVYSTLSKTFPGRVFYIRQNQFKDIDDILKSSYRDIAIERIKGSIQDKCSCSLRLKPLRPA